MIQRGVILNVRGCNASGKTTCVREFIRQHEDSSTEVIAGNIYTRCGRDVYVLGSYEKKNGGCDCFQGRDHVIRAIRTIIEQRKPRLVIYEGMLYSKTVKMACDIDDIFKGFGYRYKGIYLYRSFPSVIERLESRNGGAEYDVRNIRNTFSANESTYQTLKAKGMDITKINVEKIPLEEMGQIIPRVLSRRKP